MGKEFDYHQRSITKEYEENYDRIFKPKERFNWEALLFWGIYFIILISLVVYFYF